MESSNKLKRGLSTRHIRFMALGSAIGTGLFYGSADAIKMAGPSVLLAYIIGGVAAYIIMRALGEMSVHNPAASSFSRYAQENLGGLAGYITGWTYCFEILIVAIADVTAFGIYMGVWFPTVPHWIWVLPRSTLFSKSYFRISFQEFFPVSCLHLPCRWMIL